MRSVEECTPTQSVGTSHKQRDYGARVTTTSA